MCISLSNQYENHRFFDWYTNRMGGSSLYFDIIKDYGENMYIPIQQVYGPSPLPIAVMTPLIVYRVDPLQ